MSEAQNDPERHVDLAEIHLGSGGTIRTKPENLFTHAQFLAALRERFGPSPYDWAFICPNCGDIATGADFRAALEAHPRPWHDEQGKDRLVVASDLLGQQCIGRVLGALSSGHQKGSYTGRGCDWAAGGLFSGPTYVELPGSRWTPSFRIAPANTVSDRDTVEDARQSGRPPLPG